MNTSKGCIVNKSVMFWQDSFDIPLTTNNINNRQKFDSYKEAIS
jgi:hypothetical protein